MQLRDLGQSVILNADHLDVLDAFLQGGWVIIETIKKRTSNDDGTSFNDEVRILLGAPASVSIPVRVEALQRDPHIYTPIYDRFER